MTGVQTKIIGGLLGVIALGFLFFMWRSAEHRLTLTKIELTKVEAKAIALEKRTTQLERAALERLEDTDQIEGMKKDLTDAIQSAAKPGLAPGPTSVALGCARLRQAGRAGSDAFKRVCGGR